MHHPGKSLCVEFFLKRYILISWLRHFLCRKGASPKLSVCLTERKSERERGRKQRFNWPRKMRFDRGPRCWRASQAVRRSFCLLSRHVCCGIFTTCCLTYIPSPVGMRIVGFRSCLFLLKHRYSLLPDSAHNCFQPKRSCYFSLLFTSCVFFFSVRSLFEGEGRPGGRDQGYDDDRRQDGRRPWAVEVSGKSV